MLKTVLGFDYEKLGECSPVNVDELFMLNWFMLFYPNMTKKTINGIDYGWVSYSYFRDTYKRVGFTSKQKVVRTFNKLVEKGFLLHVTSKERGTYSYYFPTKLSKNIWVGDELPKSKGEQESIGKRLFAKYMM